MAAADKDGTLGPASGAAQASGTTRTGSGADQVDAGGEPVSPTELNAWRRGFTPQAEIWNGRLAMVGLSVGLTVLLIARLAAR
jgi:hypothetical protein